jgi:hypothetical protein
MYMWYVKLHTVTPDDGRIPPKHVAEKQGDNKRVALWTEVQCVNETLKNLKL